MHNSRKQLVAGNWKMNGSLPLLNQFQQLFAVQQFNNVDALLCPPFPYLISAASDTNTLRLGAQNLSEHNSGAHTGEVSGEMLREVGCEFVIVGHSERRSDNQESNHLVAEKVQQALNSQLIPILCVGEPEDIRDENSHLAYIAAQLNAVIKLVGISEFSQLVVAYEPVWAIGTGKTASPEQAQEVHAFIRDFLSKEDLEIAQSVRILYGGSVKQDNAAQLFAQPDVDGGLIGGASLDPQAFLAICQAADV